MKTARISNLRLLVMLSCTLLSLSPLVSTASEQESDTFIYDVIQGESIGFTLNDDLASLIDKRIENRGYVISRTSLNRGYIANLEIKNLTLFVKSLQIPERKDISESKLYKIDVGDGMEASWFSGKILVRAKNSNDDMYFYFVSGKLKLIEPAMRKQEQ